WQVGPNDAPPRLGIPVFSLGPTDIGAPFGEILDWVIPLPVAVIENLLLDTVALWEVLAPYAAVTHLVGEDEIRSSLRSLAQDRFVDEILLRVSEFLPPRPLPGRVLSPEAEGPTPHPEDIATWATRSVDRILADGRHLEKFNGRALLEAF